MTVIPTAPQFGGRRGTRTPKPVTASRFQGGVLVQPDAFHTFVNLVAEVGF